MVNLVIEQNLNLKENASNEHFSKKGYKFNESDLKWKLDKDVSVNLKFIRQDFEAEIVDSLIKALVYYAKNNSSTTTQTYIDELRYFTKLMDVNCFTESSLINYKSMLTHNDHHLGKLSSFLRKCNDLGYPVISNEVYKMLTKWKLKGNPKGDLVKRRDPLKGPLTDLELLAFNTGAINAFEKELITICDLAIGFCCSHTGRRPIQISHLKIKDVLAGQNVDKDIVYKLMVPRAKQPGATFREQFRLFTISKEFWVILTEQTKHVIESVQKKLEFELSPSNKNELPLFPNFDAFDNINSNDDLAELANSERLHCKVILIDKTLKKIVKAGDIYSERTGELLSINGYRFRYAVGTRAARDGFGIYTIAELLDQSDTQSVNVYVESVSDVVEHLDQAMGQYLAPFA